MEQEKEESHEELNLTEEEMKMAIEHGLIDDPANKKEEEKDEESDDASEGEEEANEEEESSEDGDEEESEEEEESDDDIDPDKIEHSSDLDDAFEKMDGDAEKEHKNLRKFSKAQQAFYFKWKNNKKRMQVAEAETQQMQLRLKMLEDKIEAGSIDGLLERERQAEEGNKPVTRRELDELRQKESSQKNKVDSDFNRLREHEAQLRVIHDDYDDVIEVFKKELQHDKDLQELFVGKLQNPEANASEYAYKFGKKMMPKRVDKDVKKVIKKSKRQQTSAGAGLNPTEKVRKKQFSDLTAEEVVRLSAAEYAKIPADVREKLLASV